MQNFEIICQRYPVSLLDSSLRHQCSVLQIENRLDGIVDVVQIQIGQNSIVHLGVDGKTHVECIFHVGLYKRIDRIDHQNCDNDVDQIEIDQSSTGDYYGNHTRDFESIDQSFQSNLFVVDHKNFEIRQPVPLLDPN